MIIWIGVGIVFVVDAVLICRNEKRRTERKVMLEQMEFDFNRNN